MEQHSAWQWTDAHTDTFNELKVHFMAAPVLMQLDHSCPFHIHTDVLLIAISAVLKQMNLTGEVHPCAFFSQALTSAERNYDIYD